MSLSVCQAAMLNVTKGAITFSEESLVALIQARRGLEFLGKRN